ncbi:bZIP transcription factor, partial [Salmonella sp. s51228]|uniref:bZIP transcription factor n=1 Tax=Salmonella sp. s51228 TaxID=3159652 RepID=UPI00398171E9
SDKKHLNKEYLASLSLQAQSDPDIFGKVSFIVFQELIDSEFLSPELKQRARHYRRRHRNKLAAKICRDKKQNKIKDLNTEIDELKKQIYMVKSERDMLRTEVGKLSAVHLQKGYKEN